MLVGEAVPLLDLPVTAMCADMEAHEVVVIYRDGKEKRLDAACRPPTEVLVLAQKIDSVFSMLSWTPVNTGH
jgi:hypothetical protein